MTESTAPRLDAAPRRALPPLEESGPDRTADDQPGAPATRRSAEPVIEFQGVGVRYDHGGKAVWPVRGVDLVLFPGETTALLGVSGSGKSTLLSLAGLLRRPTEGEVRFLGRPVSTATETERDRTRRDRIGFIFQDGALIEHLSVVENVMLPLLATSSSATTERAVELLTSVGLRDHLDKLPGAISGGQAQRAAFCRAVIHEPALIVADEPTASLDAESADAVLGLLRDYARSGAAVLMATHDPRASRQADHVVVLDPAAVAPR